MVERVKCRENVTDVNNNNDFTSTFALPFVDFKFYTFESNLTEEGKPTGSIAPAWDNSSLGFIKTVYQW